MDYTSVSRSITLQRIPTSDHYSDKMAKDVERWNNSRDKLTARVAELATGRKEAAEAIESIDPAELDALTRLFTFEQFSIIQDALKGWTEHPSMVEKVIDDLKQQLQQAKERTTAAADKVSAKLQAAGVGANHAGMIANDDPEFQQAAADVQHIEGLLKNATKMVYKGQASDLHSRAPLDDCQKCLQQAAAKITGEPMPKQKQKAATFIG